jgi:hypothetical protein
MLLLREAIEMPIYIQLRCIIYFIEAPDQRILLIKLNTWCNSLLPDEVQRGVSASNLSGFQALQVKGHSKPLVRLQSRPR